MERNDDYDIQLNPGVHLAATNRLFESSTVPSQFAHQGLLSYPLDGDLCMSKWYIKGAITHVSA